MSEIDRRKFLKLSANAAGAAIALNMLPPLIQKALAVSANNNTKSIKDVKHIVILMQENRSFDHYFGTMRGVRGFGDRFPIPLESGKNVFFQSDGEKVVPPYRVDKKNMNAALIHGTPHDFADTQAAWNQGKYGLWPKFKTPYSMAYYTREEIPFQYALAESFTISDAYHCSVATGTDPNRIVFFSGSNFNPKKRAQGINCTDQDSEPVNLRCWPAWPEGGHGPANMPSPGYTYRSNAFQWDTIPDVLEKAGVSWRIYQNPNDNFMGSMNGCLAFESFRSAKPGSNIYENGLKHWSVDDLTNHVKKDTLPEVSWILPSQLESEHPSGPSSPTRGGDFTHQILTALTSNPEVWGKTAFFLTFDENDGLFDHMPAPAVPSYNNDGTMAGKSTIEVDGMYFNNVQGTDTHIDPLMVDLLKNFDLKGYDYRNRFYQDKRDTISGKIRPWGMGPRVPLYIVSPWSKGGWVDSQVADHTSVGQFIEKRFGVIIPAISPWHRAVSSDLTSAFDFESPNDPKFPDLPKTSNYIEVENASKLLPLAGPPKSTEGLYQEKGTRFSRPLPYQLNTEIAIDKATSNIRLLFANNGKAGVVFHVYDKLHLEKIPRRYTVEAGKTLDDSWLLNDSNGVYDLEVHGPNGFYRSYKGNINKIQPQISLINDSNKNTLIVSLVNYSDVDLLIHIEDLAYKYKGEKELKLQSKKSIEKKWDLVESGLWYDFEINTKDDETYSFRFAGRLENGKPGISDPAMASLI